MPEKANIKKKLPSEITDEDLAEADFGNGVTIATIRLYIEKVSPFNHEAYSKNVYLDRCIEELFMEIENKKMKNHADIEKMKKYIEGQEELAELVEQFGEDGVEDNLIEGEEAAMGAHKPRKTKMCKDFMETGKCKNGIWGKESKCKFAHNPI